MSRLFGAKLLALRHEHKLTQGELARQVELESYTTITKLEGGQREPSLELIARLAEFFGVTTDYLLMDILSIDSIFYVARPSTSQLMWPPTLLGTKIRTQRIQQQISQSDLARQLTITSRTHLNNIEAGRKMPSPVLIIELATILRVTTDYLLRDDMNV